MGKNTVRQYTQGIVEKIFNSHLVSGQIKQGSPISLKVDQTLTQDATGTMAYLQFEAIGLNKIKIPLAVSYADHNTLQTDYRNADDHAFLQTAAAKYGVYFSRPGNGICHQVNLERFSRPGHILLGSASHTPTAGGIGMIGIGVPAALELEAGHPDGVSGVVHDEGHRGDAESIEADFIMIGVDIVPGHVLDRRAARYRIYYAVCLAAGG